MERDLSSNPASKALDLKDLKLPALSNSLESSLKNGHTLNVDGTNVLRVPFGVRQPRKQRPQRPERWATLVIPFQPHGHPTPPQAA